MSMIWLMGSQGHRTSIQVSHVHGRNTISSTIKSIVTGSWSKDLESIIEPRYSTTDVGMLTVVKMQYKRSEWVVKAIPREWQ